ncbi:MAG: hypothetical protein HOP10_09940 [Chitinophagaceae bacterium]|nr:hypothetical protein [Chitinophagaceae bacterium]
MKLLLLFPFIAAYFFSNAQSSSQPVIRLTDSVQCTNVKDQSQSPTCWAFGTNSLFESDILKITGKRLNLSEMFIARYAYIDKINMFLATRGKTYCEGGGQFHDVLRVIDRYGIVPEDAYPGRPNGESSHNHAELDTTMKEFMYDLLEQGKTELSGDDLRRVNKILDQYLGKVPQTFWYDLKDHTPKTFAKEIMPSTSDYVELMSFPDLPYYKKCLLVDRFNWANDSICNIPLTDFQMLIDTALAKGWSVGWEGDVTNEGFNSFGGLASTNTTYQTYDAIRPKNYADLTTERDHMLHIVGIGKDENNKKWYYLKNSWGTWLSKYKGYLYMDENYFRLNTVIVMTNKAGLPEALKRKLGL